MGSWLDLETEKGWLWRKISRTRGMVAGIGEGEKGGCDFSFYFSNWSVAYLQCCASLCYSATGTQLYTFFYILSGFQQGSVRGDIPEKVSWVSPWKRWGRMVCAMHTSGKSASGSGVCGAGECQHGWGWGETSGRGQVDKKVGWRWWSIL